VKKCHRRDLNLRPTDPEAVSASELTTQPPRPCRTIALIDVVKIRCYHFININICSIELIWNGKITKIWYDNDRDEVNTNNGVKWRIFIVPKKVEQINDQLFIDTYKSNNIKIGVNDMTVNDREMCVRWKDEDTRDISHKIA